MSIKIPKVEFRIMFVFCVYYRYVKPERKSLVKREKKFNNTIIDSIITGLDGWVLSVFIQTHFALAMGWLLCTCHSTNYYESDAFAFYRYFYIKILGKKVYRNF